jgi:thiol:disulfide interchange protein DsbA
VFKQLLIGIALVVGMTSAQAQEKWIEGVHYFRLDPAQPTSMPGKIEVLDVFSYACPACNAFQPTVDQLKAALPAGAQMAFLPAAFNPAEDWPVFQKGFLAAQSLKIAEKSHDAMYDAVWGSGSLAILEKASRRLLPPADQPKIEDLAKFYTRYGVKAEEFLSVANSFAIATQMKQADAAVIDHKVDGTPTLIVNGKYRVTPRSAGGYSQAMELVLFLVNKEKAAAGK